jgi:hypothetical protein
VDIEATFDSAAGVASWSLRSVDPATGQTPEDPLAGFLPPNDALRGGEGSALFTVQASTTREMGTQIDVSAAITFDMNPALQTNTLSYRIDTGV